MRLYDVNAKGFYLSINLFQNKLFLRVHLVWKDILITFAKKYELLFSRGINFNYISHWHKRVWIK